MIIQELYYNVCGFFDKDIGKKYFQHLTRLVLLECNISKNSLVEPALYLFGNYDWNSLFDVLDALYTWVGINHEKWEILGRRMKLGLWL